MRAFASLSFAACAAICACAGNHGESAGPAGALGASEAGRAAMSAAAGTHADTGKGRAGSASTAAAGSSGSSGTGTAGTAAAAGEAGSSGSTAGTPATTGNGLTPPDPSVSFDWPATLPGGDDDCRPGRYTGTFSCEYRLAPTDVEPLVVVTGPISLTLERSQDGEFLEIADGQLEGIAQLVIGFRSQLAGKLDCATGQLTANAVDGVYGFGDPALFPFGVFAGALTGSLDTLSGALDGQWDLGVDGGGGACVGPWQANWAP